MANLTYNKLLTKILKIMKKFTFTVLFAAFCFSINAQIIATPNGDAKVNSSIIQPAQRLVDTIHAAYFSQATCADSLWVQGVVGGGFVTGNNPYYNQLFQSISGLSGTNEVTGALGFFYTKNPSGQGNSNTYMKIYNVTAGKKPTGSALGTSTAILAKNLTDIPNKTLFTFSTPVALGSATSFAVVFCAPTATDTAAVRSSKNKLLESTTCKNYYADSAGAYYSSTWWSFTGLFNSPNAWELAIDVIINQTSNIQTDGYFQGLKLNTYPNPTVSSTKIVYELSKNTEYVNFDLYDATGKLIYSSSESNRSAGRYSFDLDLAKYGKGMYVYSIGTEYGRITKQLIAQ